MTDKRSGFSWIPIIIASGVVALLIIGGLLFKHAKDQVNNVALASSPKLVTAVQAQAAMYRPSRRYVGTARPWSEAHVGPQLIAGYVESVLVRPGSIVKRGQVIATIDCRTESAASKALAMQARSVDATQRALAEESARVNGLLDGGFVSPNEAQLREADSLAKQAQLFSVQAQVSGAALQIDDCIQRAPFDGEVSERLADPGAFVRPGTSIATVVDRNVVRVVIDVPEDDFDAVAPGTQLRLHLLATGKDLTAAVSRRAPAADPMLRTVHIEADLSDPERQIPVNTTVEVRLDVGTPVSTSEIPLTSATVHGSQATVFVLQDDVVHSKSFDLLGEKEGKLYVSTTLAPGSWVVTEGRTSIAEGNKVNAKKETPGPAVVTRGGDQ